MWSPDIVFKALSLSMLDSIWQMGLCWLAYLLLTRLLNSSNSRAAFTGGYLFSLVGVISWGITFYSYLNSTSFSFPLSGNGFFHIENYGTEHFILFRFFSTLYLAGLSIVSLQFIVQYSRVHSIVQAPSTPAPEVLTSFVQKRISQMGISRKVQIKISELTQVPFTYGFWKPVILFPLAAVNYLDLYETEAILFHELEHIRRKDYLLNYWIIVLDLLFFFNPFSRAFTSTLREIREQCCDDQVLKNDYPAWQYASALLKLAEKENSPSPRWMLGAISKSYPLLQKRIERFIRPSPAPVIPLPVGQWILSFGLLSALYLLQPIQVNRSLPVTAEVKMNSSPENARPASTGSNPRLKTKATSYLPHPRKTQKQMEIAPEDRTFRSAVTFTDKLLLLRDNPRKNHPLYTNVQLSEKRDLTYAETTPPTPVNEQHQLAEGWNQPYVPKNSFLHGENTEIIIDSISRQVTPQQWKALCYQLLLHWERTHHSSSSPNDLDVLYKIAEEQLRKKFRPEVAPQKGNKKVISL